MVTSVVAFWAQSGLMDLCKASDDSMELPRAVDGGIGDYNTGVQMTGGVFAALYARTCSGVGQLVDASLMRTGVFSMATPLVMFMGGNPYGTGIDWRNGQPSRDGPLRGTAVVGERVSITTKTPFKLKCAPPSSDASISSPWRCHSSISPPENENADTSTTKNEHKFCTLLLCTN